MEPANNKKKYVNYVKKLQQIFAMIVHFTYVIHALNSYIIKSQILNI